MFCSIFFRPLYQPWGFLVFEHPGVCGMLQKQPQITESDLGLFLLRGGSNSKMVAPHLMCSRIFFR